MRLGILGGTFDPIHNGHLHMAVCAQQEYHLDEVWLMPTGPSPHKEDAQITSCEQRVVMAQLAVEGIIPKISVSTLETESADRSYTFRTLQKIKKMLPDAELYFIAGADSLAYMDHWVHPEIIFQNAVILAAGRDTWHEEELAEKITQLQKLYDADIRIVHCDNLPVASHEIRNLIAAKEDVSDLIPKRVEEYIHEHGLYDNNGATGHEEKL